MSTRSCIARSEGSGWRGVYHYSDGYPSGLGCYIFRSIRRDWGGDAGAFLNYALSHDGGWSHIFPSDVVEEGESFRDARMPQCYCHGYFAQRDKIKPGDGHGVITGCQCHEKPYISGDYDDMPSCDPLFIEWVYVIDPDSRTMMVLKSHNEVIPDSFDCLIVHLDGAREEMPKRAYRHRINAVVDLDGPEPDWWEMEKEQFTPEHLEQRETWVDQLLSPVIETRV